MEGGGRLTVESTGQGTVTLEGEEVDVQSGGVIEGDIVTFKVTNFTVRQAALVKCRYKVRVYRIAQCFTLYCPGRPVQSNTITTSLGNIKP